MPQITVRRFCSRIRLFQIRGLGDYYRVADNRTLSRQPLKVRTSVEFPPPSAREIICPSAPPDARVEKVQKEGLVGRLMRGSSASECSETAARPAAHGMS